MDDGGRSVVSFCAKAQLSVQASAAHVPWLHWLHCSKAHASQPRTQRSGRPCSSPAGSENRAEKLRLMDGEIITKGWTAGARSSRSERPSAIWVGIAPPASTSSLGLQQA